MNKVLLIGNLGADPELRYLPGESKVLTVNLATSQVYKDKNGERQTQTDWHRCVFWNRSAEIVGQYCKKGSKLFVEGLQRTRDYERDGVKQYVTEVIVRNVELLDRKTGSGVPGPMEAAMPDDFDEDIPF